MPGSAARKLAQSSLRVRQPRRCETRRSFAAKSRGLLAATAPRHPRRRRHGEAAAKSFQARHKPRPGTRRDAPRAWPAKPHRLAEEGPMPRVAVRDPVRQEARGRAGIDPQGAACVLKWAGFRIRREGRAADEGRAGGAFGPGSGLCDPRRGLDGKAGGRRTRATHAGGLARFRRRWSWSRRFRCRRTTGNALRAADACHCSRCSRQCR